MRPRPLPIEFRTYLTGISLAAAAAIGADWLVSQWGAWVAILLAAPLFLTYRTYHVYLDRLASERRQVQQMADLHLATIEALALAIDAKDQTGQAHIRRVQAYAAGLARELGMSNAEIQGVKTAALLHDIGKLAVPEHILSKRGRLTHEEFQKIRIHPQVGAEIIRTVPFPYPVAPLILSHHERWDGKGYPQGLRGADIPLGARILATVDQFDALVSDRPYHKKISHESAIAVLQQEAGKALDPDVVRLFIELLPRLSHEAARAAEGAARSGAEDRTRADGLTEDRSTNVFDDIALAHREIYVLYEIAQAMGTSLGVTETIGVVSSKLGPLVPFTSCALFLFDEGREALHCRFASGAEADILGALTLRRGLGPTGWVATHGRSLVNARPSADFEAAGLTMHPTTLQTMLISPLVVDGRCIGTLGLYNTAPDSYTDDHRRLLERVSEQAAAVIHNQVVFEQTQEDSLTDVLTGLPNTRFMVTHITRELSRAERLRSEIAMLVMDLDNFKDINDTYGHHVGDRALREVAQVLREAIRPYDICVRYAGDEFVVVLSGCGQEQAEQKRTELQDAVARMRFEAGPGRLVPLSLSVGAAVYPYDGGSYEALLATADSRMYHDKTHRKRESHGDESARSHAMTLPPMTPSPSDSAKPAL